jgi:hypothetical protein
MIGYMERAAAKARRRGTNNMSRQRRGHQQNVVRKFDVTQTRHVNGHRNGRTLESNGPMGRMRGPAGDLAEKYILFARDASSSGDTVAAEALYQYAEHYFRVVAEESGGRHNNNAAPSHGQSHAAV